MAGTSRLRLARNASMQIVDRCSIPTGKTCRRAWPLPFRARSLPGARGCDATCTMLWFVPIGRGGCWMSRAPTRGSKRLPYKAIEIFMGAIVAMQHLFDYSAAVSSTLLFRCGFSPSPKVLGLFASGRRAGGVFDCGHTGSRQARKRMRKQVGSNKARQEVGSPIGHPVIRDERISAVPCSM